MTMNLRRIPAALALCAAFTTASWAAAPATDADFAAAARSVAESAAKGIRSQAAMDQHPSDHSVLRDETTVVPVDLNPATVKCSAADYSGPMLKVLIPGLADLTVLNHRNTREGAPCVAAGRCGEVSPKDILKSGEGVDRVAVRVILKKVAELDGDVCHVSLVETVNTSIRGVPFFHERRQDVADRAAADCR